MTIDRKGVRSGGGSSKPMKYEQILIATAAARDDIHRVVTCYHHVPNGLSREPGVQISSLLTQLYYWIHRQSNDAVEACV